MWLAANNAISHDCSHRLPLTIQSPVAKGNSYPTVTLCAEGDFWAIVDDWVEEMQGSQVSLGEIAYDTFKAVDFCPFLLVSDVELNHIIRHRSVAKPSYFEYDNLPAEWTDISLLIEAETAAVMVALKNAN